MSEPAGDSLSGPAAAQSFRRKSLPNTVGGKQFLDWANHGIGRVADHNSGTVIGDTGRLQSRHTGSPCRDGLGVAEGFRQKKSHPGIKSG